MLKKKNKYEHVGGYRSTKEIHSSETHKLMGTIRKNIVTGEYIDYVLGLDGGVSNND